MFSVYAKIPDVTESGSKKKPKWLPMSEKRVLELGQRRGLQNVRQIEMAAKVPVNNLQKYIDGMARPNSEVLLNLCETLNTTPSYLYGRPVSVCQAQLVKAARTLFSETHAQVLEQLSQLDVADTGRLVGMLDVLLKQSAASLPPSRFQIDANARGATRGESHVEKEKKKIP